MAELQELPDYVNDLNAIYKVWETLTNEEKIALVRWIIYRSQINPNLLLDIAAPCVIDAFKEHFCEAFLRIKGRWEL